MPWTVRVAVVGLSIAAGSVVHAKTVETSVLGGVSVHEYTHGVVNLGIRKSDLSAEWLTDTLDLRWSPDLEQGRAWVALRGQLGAVGLMISPWEAGRPVREQGFAGACYGGEAGVVRYLRHGLYVGTAASARRAHFFPIPETRGEVPGPTPWLGVDGIAGWYADPTHVWLRVGAQHDRMGTPFQPHAHLVASRTSRRRFGHRLDLYAGWSQGVSALTSTRVGGQNPYVVPVSGAGWGEWWATSYAVARLGPQLRIETAQRTILLAPVVDGVLVDDVRFGATRGWGAGLLSSLEMSRLTFDGSIGWGGGLPRAEGVRSVGAWFGVGHPWR